MVSRLRGLRDSLLAGVDPAAPRRQAGLTASRARAREVALVAAYVVAYAALDRATDLFPAVAALGITPWNPPPGLSLALLLRTGTRNGPWLFVAALVTEIMLRGSHGGALVLLVAAALPAVVYTATAAVLARRLRFDPDFTTVRDGVVFIGAATAGSAVMALAYVGWYVTAGALPSTTYVFNALTYWIGDLIGIVVTTPLLLVATRRPRPRLARRPAEALVQMATIAAILWIVFASGWAEELKLFYAIFLPLVWVAMRRGIEGTVIATALIQVGMMIGMDVSGYPAGAALEFQMLLLTVALTGLILGLAVSERRQVERRLREREAEVERGLRFAGASAMASALAHELNQPLAAIGSYVRACQLMLSDKDSTHEALRGTMEKVVREVTRAADVVRNLREFFGAGSSRRVPVAVAPVIGAVLESARERLDHARVHVTTSTAPGLPRVSASAAQIEIVLHNLVSNAMDALEAMPAADRRLDISAVPDGSEFVRISVTDSGPGVSTPGAESLFQPFATSKPEGMGLGLAISRSIVEAHGGRLWHEHRARGASFAFTLPVSPP
ncbi:MAG TPA: MASE1 domain-containing protein [Casimicrobiaceae bacterium]